MKKLLYFSASWCGPCKAMKPLIAELEAGGLRVERYDADVTEHLSKFNERGVFSMPTFVVLDDDKEVARAVGAMPKRELEALLA